MTFDDYKAFLLADDAYTIENAAETTHIPAEKIIRAAEMLVKPRGKLRPKASFMLEKGNYWSFNFPNSSSLSALGLTCGAGSRPGQVISRAGGHQRGMMKAAGYPLSKSPVVYEDAGPDAPGGGKIPLNFDKWTMEGNLRLAYVVGHSWVSAMSAGQSLRDSIQKLTRSHPVQVDSLDREEIIASLKERVDQGGMMLIQQETYANDLTEYVDMVLPAATWGEEDFTRAQGERRLRMYSKFYDPPGLAKPDWWIVGQIAQKMGYEGFDWEDGNAIFEEASARSEGGHYDYSKLIEKAKADGVRSHELLRSLSTTGIQLPIRLIDGEMVGTPRLHDETIPAEEEHNKNVKFFKTASGKAIFMRGDWRLVDKIYEKFKPKPDELWVLNGRINHIWQTMYDDLRSSSASATPPTSSLSIQRMRKHAASRAAI